MSKEVNVADILDQDDMVVSTKGFTRGQLKTAFDKLTEKLDDWKMPINTVIHIKDWYLMIEACSLFTGSQLWQVKDLGLGLMHVKADGYYNTEAKLLAFQVIQLPDATGA